MRVSRIYTPQRLAENTRVQLEPQASKHLVKVLRLKPGTRLVLFNGDGLDYSAVLVDASTTETSVDITATTRTKVESSLDIHLGICLSRGERMDQIVQKSTELGVKFISPLFSERSQIRLSTDRLLKKQEHWQRIAISACEQSGRNVLPEIAAAQSLADWTDNCTSDIRLTLDPRAAQPLQRQYSPETVALLVGPEGGLTDDELDFAGTRGFRPVALGPRIMRTETAPTACIAILQFLWGDMH
jgi:16S rRNA (uracil1498-N3)-methyltransferase